MRPVAPSPLPFSSNFGQRDSSMSMPSGFHRFASEYLSTLSLLDSAIARMRNCTASLL